MIKRNFQLGNPLNVNIFMQLINPQTKYISFLLALSPSWLINISVWLIFIEITKAA